MKFLCLICAEKVMEQMPEAEAAKHFQEYLEFTEGIKASGHFVGANRLQPAATATTVRVRNGKVLITDGPFAETKEQFGGYYLIEAKDLNEAINVAAKIPGAQRGCVEIREVAEDPQTLALGLDAPRTNTLKQ
ncbi:MAG: YciI family protein [Nitrospirota bacterium]